jgi:predicted ArsR family transcriptional regulator
MNLVSFIFRKHPPLPEIPAYFEPPAPPKTKKEIILRAIDEASIDGATVEELEAVTDISQNTIRPRLQELMEDGAINAYNHLMGLTRSGRQCKVYVTANNYVRSPHL